MQCIMINAKTSVVAHGALFGYAHPLPYSSHVTSYNTAVLSKVKSSSDEHVFSGKIILIFLRRLFACMKKGVNIFFSRQTNLIDKCYLLVGLTKQIHFKLLHIYNTRGTNTEQKTFGTWRKQNGTNTESHEYEIL